MMNKKEMEIESEPKGGVAKWLTTLMPVRAWSVIFALSVLSVMGLAFLWSCPETSSRMIQDAHWMFKRQVAWLGIGLSTCALGWMVSWRRWLKVSPWLAVGWFAMFVVAICSPQVNHNLYVHVGPGRLNVLAFCPLVVAFLLAWIAGKLASRRAVVVLLVVAVVSACAFAVWTLDGHEGVARILGCESVKEAPPDEVMLREWAQEACGVARREAHWFSGNDEALQSLVGRHSYCMPFGAALAFGKWFPAVALALFGMFAATLACCYRKARSASKKLFVAATGFFILSMAACGYSAYFGLVPPMLHACVPVVSYGGSVVVFAWLMAGIVCRIACEDDATSVKTGGATRGAG